MTLAPRALVTLTLLAALAPACGGPQPAPAPQLAAAAATLPVDVVGITWEWVGFTSPVEQITVDAPEKYTIRFESGGRISMQADCNRGVGSYTAGPDRRIELKGIALTRMLCPPGSQGDRFAREAGRAAVWFLKDGGLYLDLPVDSGTLRFRRQP
jgi:heat shock protein HslJ